MPGKYSNLILSGQRRSFFLILALLLLAQAAIFLADRMQTALTLINEDFKIAVSLNNASASDAAAFKKALGDIPGVRKLREIDAQQTIDSLKQPGTSFSALMRTLSPDFLPRFYEVSVTESVMLNPKVWVQNNIASMDYDAQAYYKDDHAKLAVYINALMRFADILLAAAAFAILAFGFFVEAYYTKIASLRDRAGGVLTALFAFALVWGIVYIMAAPLNKIYPDFRYDMFGWRQAALLAAAFLTGWTLAKWKRF